MLNIVDKTDTFLKSRYARYYTQETHRIMSRSCLRAILFEG